MAATPVEVRAQPPINPEVPKVAAMAKEKVASPPKEKQQGGVARKKLEDIAAGKPVLDVVSSENPAISKEMAMQLLKEANALLLDMKDLRLFISSLATQSADTPLGDQMRMEALIMLKEIAPDSVDPQLAPRLAALQEKLSALPLSKANPAENPLVSIIQEYNISHPHQRVPEELLAKIQSGDVKSSEILVKILESNKPLAQVVWKEMTNDPNEFKGFNPQPDTMLELAGLPLTKENMKKAEAIFASSLPLKEKPNMVSTIMSGVVSGALLLMFVSQMASSDQQQGH